MRREDGRKVHWLAVTDSQAVPQVLLFLFTSCCMNLLRIVYMTNNERSSDNNNNIN